jgi:hypothetical protein
MGVVLEVVDDLGVDRGLVREVRVGGDFAELAVDRDAQDRERRVGDTQAGTVGVLSAALRMALELLEAEVANVLDDLRDLVARQRGGVDG